jgi:hypothetical protein
VSRITVAGISNFESIMHKTRHFMRLPETLLRNVGLRSKTPVFQNPEVTIQQIPFVDPVSGDAHCCFLACSAQLPGKFDTVKAQFLGVPKGPLFGKLKSGQAITLPSGETVQPDQVLGPLEPSKYFAVICKIAPCQTDLLHRVVSHESFLR